MAASRALLLTAILFAMLTAASLPPSAQFDPCSSGGDSPECKNSGQKKKKQKAVTTEATAEPNPFEKIPRTVGEAKRLSRGVMYVGGAQDTDEFKTYSIFLIPSHEWARHNGQEFTQLHRGFENFGEKIGGQHLVVWFSTLGEGHDVERDQKFCMKFNLGVLEGPYVIMMRKHPDDLNEKDKVLTIQLKGIDATRVMNVLNVLVKDLQSGSVSHKEAIELEQLLQIFLSAKDKNGLTGIAIALFKPPSN